MRIASIIIKIAVIAGLIILGFLLWPGQTSTNQKNDNPSKISLVKTAFNFITDKSEPLKGEEKGRVNILFLGLPGEGNNAPNLTDTIILLSIKPETNQLALLSLPRDLLVYLPKSNSYTKINTLFQMDKKNPETIINKVEEITGQNIHYYAALDVSGVEKIIDILGGINVWVAEDIYDPQFPTPGYGTEVFTVQKGWRYFNGKTAQRYLRTRYSPDGDYARMRQQQAVVEALRKKVFGLNLLYDFPTILSIYRTAKAHIQTDLDEDAIKRLYDIAKNISYDKVIHKVVDGDPTNPEALLTSKTIQLGENIAFVLVPKAGEFDYSDIQVLSENIFN